MNIPVHSYKTLKKFGNITRVSAPVKFNGWLGSDIYDKNGREVFEGDIVNINGTPAGAVYFREGAFRAGGMLLKDYNDGEIEIVGHISEDSK